MRIGGSQQQYNRQDDARERKAKPSLEEEASSICPEVKVGLQNLQVSYGLVPRAESSQLHLAYQICKD